MKMSRALNLIMVGGATLLLLKPGTANLAQDRPAQRPLTTIVSAMAPKLADCSTDGEFYVCATRDGRIKYARAEDGATLRTFYVCQPQSVALSPDGRLLAVTGNFNGCFSKIKVWSVKDGSLLCTLETEAGHPSFLRFSPDGVFLAATDGSRIDLWHLEEKRVKWFETFPNDIAQIVFNSQHGGVLLVVCEDGASRRFSLPEFTSLEKTPSQGKK